MPRFLFSNNLLFLLGMILVCSSTTFSQDTETAEKQETVTPVDLTQAAQSTVDGSLKDKASLLLGFNFIDNLKRQEVEVNFEKLIEGIRLAESGGDLPMDDEEIRSVMTGFQRSIQARQRAKAEKMAAENLAKGTAFLEKNGQREGVKLLDSGVQYEVIQSGDASGESPKPADRVKVNYKGMLINGEQFDASGENAPAEFAVGGVIRGFSSALSNMKKGDKWKIYIPAELAYGKRGSGRRIGPNEALIFEVEMVDVIKKTDDQ